jgi:hypothetical protein
MGVLLDLDTREGAREFQEGQPRTLQGKASGMVGEMRFINSNHSFGPHSYIPLYDLLARKGGAAAFLLV